VVPVEVAVAVAADKQPRAALLALVVLAEVAAQVAVLLVEAPLEVMAEVDTRTMGRIHMLAELAEVAGSEATAELARE